MMYKFGRNQNFSAAMSWYKTANILASIHPIWKILLSADSEESLVSEFAKISTRELVRIAENTKFDTREN